MCVEMTTRAAVLTGLLARLDHHQLQPPWPRRGVRSDCRRVPSDDEAIPAWLASEFSEEQLEASGVVTRSCEGRFSFTRPLGPPGGVVVALREKEGEPPFEILTPTGGLVDGEIALLSTLRDYRTAKWLGNTGGRLFICNGTCEVAVLWSAHLPAATSAGLEELSGRRFRELAGELGWRKSKPPVRNNGAPKPVHLTLVGWHPATLSRKESNEARAVAELLARVERCLGVDMSCCDVWQPTGAEIEDIRFCLQRRDTGAARKSLLASAENSSFFVSAYRVRDFRPGQGPAGLAEVLAELEYSQNQGEDTPLAAHRRRQAQAAYERFVEEDLVGPLREKAIDSDDPLGANLGIVAAEVFRAVHLEAPAVRRIVHDLVHDSLFQNDRNQQDLKPAMDLLREHGKQVSSVIQLIREMRR